MLRFDATPVRFVSEHVLMRVVSGDAFMRAIRVAESARLQALVLNLLNGLVRRTPASREYLGGRHTRSDFQSIATPASLKAGRKWSFSDSQRTECFLCHHPAQRPDLPVRRSGCYTERQAQCRVGDEESGRVPALARPARGLALLRRANSPESWHRRRASHTSASDGIGVA